MGIHIFELCHPDKLITFQGRLHFQKYLGNKKWTGERGEKKKKIQSWVSEYRDESGEGKQKEMDEYEQTTLSEILKELVNILLNF